MKNILNQFEFLGYLSVDDSQFSNEAVKTKMSKSLYSRILFYARSGIMSYTNLWWEYIRDRRRVVIRELVTRISSRAAKRVNDKRATGINLSSFPGWWSGNFLLIVGGNRVCRPVDQTLNSSLLRCALLPIRLPNGYTASTNRCCTVCTSATPRALLVREPGAYCMDRAFKRFPR